MQPKKKIMKCDLKKCTKIELFKVSRVIVSFIENFNVDWVIINWVGDSEEMVIVNERIKETLDDFCVVVEKMARRLVGTLKFNFIFYKGFLYHK